jgi:hypothetical protein
LVFDVMVDGSFAGTTIDMQASTDGVCDPSGLMLSSSADATARLRVPSCGDGCSATCAIEAPTLGQWGAIMLALVLLVLGVLGAQASNRQRSV